MSPEYGATCGFFPVDDVTLDYLRLTGRPPERIALVEAYCKENMLWHDPSEHATYSEVVELDLGDVEPSLAGPRRPQDRVPLARAKEAFLDTLGTFGVDLRNGSHDKAVADTFPASDPTTEQQPGGAPEPEPDNAPVATAAAPGHKRTPVAGADYELDHGSVVIAAITSCTNTSNPQVMVAAGLLARNAVARGLQRQPWVKSSLAPGSKVVTRYYEQAGLQEHLDTLGFNTVGYGCTTCIGNSGPLADEIAGAIGEGDLVVCSVLSGNRNFEARIHPEVKANYLASPPLVVAYSLAGRMDIDWETEPVGTGSDGEDVFLHDIWPSAKEVSDTIATSVRAEHFSDTYADVFTGDELWRDLPVPEGELFAWAPESTYVRHPPYFEGMSREPGSVGDIEGARVLVWLGDSVTTDHISPAGSIRPDSPAGAYLLEHDVARKDFNSYGARRGNHEVMVRGTFANVRLRNKLVPGSEGTWTKHIPSDEEMTIYDASRRYLDEGTPTIVIAGKEYGSGSSRDWAAKGPNLLGVKAVIVQSYERIHRSNLLMMGVLPLQFMDGESPETLGLTGSESFSIHGVENGEAHEVTVRADDKEFRARVRLDTPREREYLRHGGILPYVLRRLPLLRSSSPARRVAGKTTTAAALRDRLGSPLVAKDALKETLARAARDAGRDASHELGAAVFHLMATVVHELLAHDVSLICEGNFVAGERRLPRPAAGADRAGARSAPPEVLRARLARPRPAPASGALRPRGGRRDRGARGRRQVGAAAARRRADPRRRDAAARTRRRRGLLVRRQARRAVPRGLSLGPGRNALSCRDRGPRLGAEITPVEPAPGHAGEGSAVTSNDTPSWGIEPVPERLRVLGALDGLLLWSNLSVSLLVIVAGAFLVLPADQFGLALSLPVALAAIVAAAVVGNFLLGLGGLIGADARVPTMVLLRARSGGAARTCRPR